jgi:hypothetical protein
VLRDVRQQLGGWVVVKFTSVEEGSEGSVCSAPLASYEGRHWDGVGIEFIPEPASILTSQSWVGDVPVFEVTLETAPRKP